MTSYCFKRVRSKSIVQYRKERQRRKQVMRLSEQRLTRKEIAGRLGISVRTVKRDWKKLQPYILGQTRRHYRQLDDRRTEEFRAKLEGLSSLQKLRLIESELKAQRQSLQIQEREARQLVFTVDLDNMTSGIPWITSYSRYNTFNMRKGIELKIRVRKDGVYYDYGHMQLRLAESGKQRPNSIL